MAAFNPVPITVAPVDYDSAMVARVRDSHGQLRFPQTLRWLQRRQRPDGTWGADRWHAHDRLVSTLAAVLCLHEAQVDREAVERGLDAIPELIARLGEDAQETVGFEVIAPALLDRCEASGLPIPSNALPSERQRRDERIAQGFKSSITFSLEGIDFIPPEAAKLLSPRGSLQASPAATAAYLMQYPDTPLVLAYLEDLASQNDGGIPDVHPLDSFAASWSCWHMDISGDGHLPLAQNLRKQAEQSWTPQGSSASNDMSLPNSDDTAMSYVVQRAGGKELDINVFEPFITPEGAHCYVQEFDMSISANVHILLALRAAPPSPERDEWINILLHYIRNTMHNFADHMLIDKWHLSPTYTTGHAIIATHGLDDQLCNQLCDAMIQTQHPDGAWGVMGGTAEEVAYCLYALCLAYRPAYNDAIRAGSEALERLKTTQPHLPLWIGKSLYRPITVVESGINAAQKLVAQRHRTPPYGGFGAIGQ